MWISWQKSNSDTYHPGPRRGAYVGTAWHRLENERNNARVVGIEATGLGLSQTRRPRRPLSFRREPSSWRCYVIDSPQRISTMTKNEILIGLSESERTKFGKEDFALQSFPQKVFSSIWAIESEVNNGGFSQFFLNSSSETVPFVADALDTIGALRTAAICRRALERAFPDGLAATPDESHHHQPSSRTIFSPNWTPSTASSSRTLITSRTCSSPTSAATRKSSGPCRTQAEPSSLRGRGPEAGYRTSVRNATYRPL